MEKEMNKYIFRIEYGIDNVEYWEVSGEDFDEALRKIRAKFMDPKYDIAWLIRKKAEEARKSQNLHRL